MNTAWPDSSCAVRGAWAVLIPVQCRRCCFSQGTLSITSPLATVVITMATRIPYSECLLPLLPWRKNYISLCFEKKSHDQCAYRILLHFFVFLLFVCAWKVASNFENNLQLVTFKNQETSGWCSSVDWVCAWEPKDRGSIPSQGTCLGCRVHPH